MRSRGEGMYRHILVATDGSELAERALTTGLTLAKCLGAKVSVVVVEAPFQVFDIPASKTQQNEQTKTHAASVLNRAADAAKRADVPCEYVQVGHEQPYQAIIETATGKGCDLIVMASHGRSGLSAKLLGSVTSNVLMHVKIPVLVCR